MEFIVDMIYIEQVKSTLYNQRQLGVFMISRMTMTKITEDVAVHKTSFCDVPITDYKRRSYVH